MADRKRRFSDEPAADGSDELNHSDVSSPLRLSDDEEDRVDKDEEIVEEEEGEDLFNDGMMRLVVHARSR